jgi:hypothetical protein
MIYRNTDSHRGISDKLMSIFINNGGKWIRKGGLVSLKFYL